MTSRSPRGQWVNSVQCFHVVRHVLCCLAVADVLLWMMAMQPFVLPTVYSPTALAATTAATITHATTATSATNFTAPQWEVPSGFLGYQAFVAVLGILLNASFLATIAASCDLRSLSNVYAVKLGCINLLLLFTLAMDQYMYDGNRGHQVVLNLLEACLVVCRMLHILVVCVIAAYRYWMVRHLSLTLAKRRRRIIGSVVVTLSTAMLIGVFQLVESLYCAGLKTTLLAWRSPGPSSHCPTANMQQFTLLSMGLISTTCTTVIVFCYVNLFNSIRQTQQLPSTAANSPQPQQSNFTPIFNLNETRSPDNQFQMSHMVNSVHQHHTSPVQPRITIQRKYGISDCSWPTSTSETSFIHVARAPPATSTETVESSDLPQISYPVPECPDQEEAGTSPATSPHYSASFNCPISHKEGLWLESLSVGEYTAEQHESGGSQATVTAISTPSLAGLFSSPEPSPTTNPISSDRVFEWEMVSPRHTKRFSEPDFPSLQPAELTLSGLPPLCNNNSYPDLCHQQPEIRWCPRDSVSSYSSNVYPIPYRPTLSLDTPSPQVPPAVIPFNFAQPREVEPPSQPSDPLPSGPELSRSSCMAAYAYNPQLAYVPNAISAHNRNIFCIKLHMNSLRNSIASCIVYLMALQSVIVAILRHWAVLPEDCYSIHLISYNIYTLSTIVFPLWYFIGDKHFKGSFLKLLQTIKESLHLLWAVHTWGLVYVF